MRQADSSDKSRTPEALLKVEGLSTAFKVEGRFLPVTQEVSFTINCGEILGLVGESGSGKSVTAKTILHLLPSPPSKILAGSIMYGGQDLVKLSEKQMYTIRGNKISMIFQEPMTSLNPVYTCGTQIAEAVTLHKKMSKKEAFARAEEMLGLVGMSIPAARLRQYPHELSGGMRQRVMIGMALSCEPELLIADEPTTALDPTIQAQILELIQKLQQKTGMTVLYITHDLGVVAELCHRVVVMYAGMIMEIADTRTLFHAAAHPYTQGLLKAIPRLGKRVETLHNIVGAVPHPADMPHGCRFHPRCPFAEKACQMAVPPMIDLGGGHQVRCILVKTEGMP